MREEKKDKSRKIVSVSYMILSILLIMGPRSFFSVCPVGENIMKCHYSSQALLPIGILILIVGVLFFFIQKNETKMVLSIITIVAAGMVIWIPAGLIGGCGMKSMDCNAHAFPAVYLIAVLLIIISCIELFLLRRSKKEE